MKYLLILALFFVGFASNAAVIGNKGVQVMEFVYDFSVDGGSVGFKNLSTKSSIRCSNTRKTW